jgi:hypothetical protein
MQELYQVIEDFVLQTVSVQCPDCEVVFATDALAHTPNMTKDTPVETDLHRILPHPALRAALIAMCPACLYTSWFSAFIEDPLVPFLAVAPAEVAFSKKFAHAVLTGRKVGAHYLDRALFALNGSWCAREAGESSEKWLELAGQELEAALEDDSWTGNRSRYQYIMGEICRLVGDFHGAVRHYNQVDRKSQLPKTLVDHQRQEAINGNSRPVQLPPEYVEAIFFPKPINLDELLGPMPVQLSELKEPS